MKKQFYQSLFTLSVFFLFLTPSIAQNGTNTCVSKATFPWEDWIMSVQIGTDVHPSGKSPYSDFSTTVFQAIPSTSISLTAGYSYFTFDEYWRVWIDLNGDGDYEDSGEKVFEQVLIKPSNGINTSKSITGNLNIPPSIFGNRTMRISMKRGAYPTPCEIFPHGEVEDYTVNLGVITKWVNLLPQNWIAPQSAAVGQTQTTTFDVRNDGTLPILDGFSVGIFLSTDNLWGSNDQLLGNKSYPNIGITTLVNESISYVIPSNAISGDYFLILFVDFVGQVAELDELDNKLTKPFSIKQTGAYCPSKGELPWQDWISRVRMRNMDNRSGKSSYSDFTAQTIDVNAGLPSDIFLEAGYSYFTYDEFWKVWIDYNQNGIFEEPSEIFVALAPPKPADGTPFHEINTSAFIKGGFTQDFTTQMRVAKKRGAYPSPCETFAFGEVEDYSIHIAPGGGVHRPDLSIANFMAANSGAQGEIVPFSFDLLNTGVANATGTYDIGAYLSNDAVLDATDVLVGSIPTGNTPIGTIPNVTGAITVPSSLSAGNYYLILKADIYNTIVETNELDNTASLNFAVTATIGGTDLELTLTADKTSLPIYSSVSLIYEVKNTGNQTITSAEIFTGICPTLSDALFSGNSGYVYAGVPAAPSLGTFNFISQKWNISNLAPGQSGTLLIKLFALTNSERKIIAYCTAQSPTDSDSQPNATLPNCSPTQDDEAVWTLNANQVALEKGSIRAENNSYEIESFLLYPNPASQEIYIHTANWKENTASVYMYNTLGYKVLERHFEKSTDAVLRLDLSDVPNGAYFLKIETAGERAVFRKMMVEKGE